jgi:PhzF family phenazine biosynthesis protein
MRLPIFQIDAFTSIRFKGNPAAVVLLGESAIPDNVLQDIAAENNLSETAFIRGSGGGYSLRWFTPEVEVDLCGHATLASAFVMFDVEPGLGSSIQFNTMSGVLTVTRSDKRLTLDFPSRPASPVAVLSEFKKAFSLQPVEAHRSRDLLLIFESERHILDLRPDFTRIAELDTSAVIASAAGYDADFVSRFFAPRMGIPEDPVTGSAHCTLIPFWADRLGKDRLHAKQLSHRGGELFCQHDKDRVLISGEAVEYMRGELFL